ncbi:MAG TPA: hypothetical protein VNP04_12675 [Alphaproteobacteria bacterium]|nr:hypothetical protein [Alphaproteobacteria bacterium]
MVVARSLGERMRDLLQISRFPSTLPEACRWAGRHPIASVFIDLERDDYQEIAQKIERWEQIELAATMHCASDMPLL